MPPAVLEELIKAMMPRCQKPWLWVYPLHQAMKKYALLDDPDEAPAFLAQLAVESQELNRVAENLFYSAERLMAVWPKRFPDLLVANKYARNPAALANYVYGGRLGNGPESSGDGYRYRGRGLMQITGKANYRAQELALGLPLVAKPDLLLEYPVAALAGAQYWNAHKLSLLADDLPDDNDDEDFATITKKINGGHHGLAQRRQYWIAGRKHLGLLT